MTGVSLATMVVIGVGAAFATQSVAQRQALEDSERTTQRLAELVVKPLLSPYVMGETDSVAELDRTIRDRMADGNLLEVTVWQADGRVLYSDDPAEMGRDVSPPPEVARAISGRVLSGFEDGAPEAATAAPSTPTAVRDPTTDEPERGQERFVEVYVPLDVAGETVAFEAYYDYRRVDEIADRLLAQTLPVVLGPLVLLQFIQIPVAISLARRLKNHEAERTRLFERALTVSDRERVRFAADLHDGPIQDLAGISYALGAVAPTVAERHAPLMERVQEALQRSIQSLRGLMTDLYPPDLGSGSLDQAINSLAEPLQAAGVDVQFELGDHEPLAEETTVAIYRVVRESLVNVHHHAQASTVVVSLHQTGGGGDGQLRLSVVDDGVGVDADRLDRRAEGHLGLRLVSDRVASLGGQVTIDSAPGEGTRVDVVLPFVPADPA